MRNILWFVAGACTGAAIGLLLAPSPGSGRELYEMGRKLADDAARIFEEGRQLMEGERDAAASS